MHKRCREIMDELILNGELEEITWFKFAPKQELKLRLKDMLEDEVDKKYLLNQELVSKYLETGTASNHKGSQAGKVADETDETFWTVNAGTHGYSMGYVKIDKKYHLSKEAIEYMNRTRDGIVRWENRSNKLNDVAHCISANFYKGVPYGVIEPYIPMGLNRTHTLNIKGNDSIKRIYSSDGLCPSLTTMQGGHREPKIAHPVREVGRRLDENKKTKKCNYIFRKLTERECFRLQGFDDNFIFPPKMSSTQLYKQAGNGMSRNILDMIFTQIFTCYAKHIEKTK